VSSSRNSKNIITIICHIRRNKENFASFSLVRLCHETDLMEDGECGETQKPHMLGGQLVQHYAAILYIGVCNVCMYECASNALDRG
jgi:hypothetical protein